MVQAVSYQHNRGVQLTDTAAVLDRDQLRDITMNDEALMREIVGVLVDDTARQIQLLAIAIREEDPQKCMRLAHYFKGACANVGANRAATLLREMERQAAARSFAACAESLQSLTREIERLREENL